MSKTAAVIVIGNEILSGKTRDENSPYLAHELRGLGVDVRVLATVGGRVTAAVTLSLMLLLAISIGLVHPFN